MVPAVSLTLLSVCVLVPIGANFLTAQRREPKSLELTDQDNVKHSTTEGGDGSLSGAISTEAAV